MKVLFRLWIIFAALWLALVAAAFRNGGTPDGYQLVTIVGVPLGPLVLIYAVRWALSPLTARPR